MSGKKDLAVHKFDLLYSQDKISAKIKELGKRISKDYADKDPILIGVLKGCIIFMADLIRNISIPLEIEFICASSYNNGRIPDGEVILAGGPNISIRGRHVLLIEGIVDSGSTVKALLERLRIQEPVSIEVATLIDKPSCHSDDIHIKYVGFEAGDVFVIGYGLDDSQKYRNLPFIGKVIC